MENLTCLTCHISLSSSISHREHYKSEWHSYNLKRKLNQLKSVTEDEFDLIKTKHYEKIAGQTKSSDASMFYCNVCHKSFINSKAFDQHNLSNKHHNRQLLSDKNESTMKPVVKVEKEKAEVEEFNESDWEELDSDEEILETIPLNECLFCSKQSANLEANLAHMSRSHSFFIPDVEYCIDVEGLLNYLGTKIASGHCCLWCSDNGKTFSTKKSTQQHMIDVGHTKVHFHNRPESLLEFEDFYDYSTSYPDAEQNGGDKDDDDADDEVEDPPILEDNDYELKLPSGRVIGHRTLMIYYKQKLKSNASVKTSNLTKNRQLVNQITSNYRGLGWTGTQSPLALQCVKDIHYMQKISKKLYLKIGLKNNLNKQTHFRSQMGFR